MQWTFNKIINMAFFQIILNFQLKDEHIQNNIMSQIHTKYTKINFWNNYIWIVMASYTFIY